jgi:hypothetical protein
MEIGAVKAWVDDVTRITEDILQQSDFYNNAHNLYKEVGVFGIGIMFVDADPEDVVRFHSYTAGEYFVQSSHKGVIDQFYRRISMTAYNILDKFGEENTPAKVKDKVKENKGNTYYNVRHQIEPNKHRDITKEDNGNMKWQSIYYMEDKTVNDKPLRSSGYNSFPLPGPRWEAVGSSVYGQSPCMRALPSVKSLQDMKKDLMKASKKTIDPMLNVPADMKDVVRSAGGVNYFAGGKAAPVISAVHQVNYDMNGNLLSQDKEREEIRSILFADLFTAISSIDKSNMTATEINARINELLRLLGPVVTRMNSEFLTPLIERVYELLLAAGKYPPPPEEIEGEDIKIVMVSSLAQAQQAVGITAIDQVTNYVAQVAQFDPSILHKFNSMQALDELARRSGAPPEIVRTDEEAQQLEAEEAQAIQAQQTGESMGMVVDGAKTLSETNVADESALTRVMGGAAGG